MLGPEVLSFDIPEASLPDALVVYSRVSGVQVTYPSDLANAHRTAAVSGAFTRAGALERLLEGSGLSARYFDEHGITLISRSAWRSAALLPLNTMEVGGDARIGSLNQFEAFTTLLQQTLIRALSSNRQTADGDYIIQLSVWIDQTGQVRRPQLFRSTGDTRLDIAILDTLSRAMINEIPPVGLPQPMNFRVRVHAPS